MLSRLIQIILVSTSISPVLLTFWFKSFSKSLNLIDGLIYLIFSLLLIILLKIILKIAQNKLEILPISIVEISNADHESVIFIFTYLIPLLEINTSMILFLLSLFLLIITTTNIYHFNLLLGILGYHQYEIKIKDGTSFILITKKYLVNIKQINKVVQLSNYILLEKE